MEKVPVVSTSIIRSVYLFDLVLSVATFFESLYWSKSEMRKIFDLYEHGKQDHSNTWCMAIFFLVFIFVFAGTFSAKLFTSYLSLDSMFQVGSWELTFVNLVCGSWVSIWLCMFWLHSVEKKSIQTIGFRSGGLEDIAKGVFLGSFYAFLVVSIIYLLGGFQIEGTGLIQDFSLAGVFVLVLLLIGLIMQGATLELLLRGWLFQALTSKYGVLVGVFGNSLAFCILKAPNFNPSIELFIGLSNIFLVSVFLSIYAHRERNILGVCAWHGLWTWVVSCGFALNLSGHGMNSMPLFLHFSPAEDAPIWLTGGRFGPEASLVTSAVMFVAICQVTSWKKELPIRIFSS